jgi:hypothetical protein
MSDLQQYSRIAVYYNSKLLSEESDVTIKRTSGSQPVHTVQKGLAGFSPGSPMCEVTVKSRIPAAGFEISSIGKDMQSVAVVELTFFAAGKTLTTKGAIMDDSTQHAVDTASEIDFTFQGQFSDWG